MPLTKFPLLGGVIKDDTPLEAEGYVTDSDKMRYRRKKWETIGGWEVATLAQFAGIARGGHAWADLAGTKAAAFGTAAKLYAYYGGDLRDITPVKTARVATNPLSTEQGSNVVLVKAPAHGLKDKDIATFSGADAVGGILVDGDYTVSVLTYDLFRITTNTTATSTVNGGGGRVEFVVPLDAGLVNGIGGLGFGSGAFGSGPFGVASSGDIHARVWSLDNFGNNLVAVPTNGGLYEWQPFSAFPELVRNGDFANAGTNWGTQGTGWTFTNGRAEAAAGAASSLVQDETGVLSGGVTYRIKFTLTRTAGSLQFRVTSAASDTPADIAFGEPFAKPGTYEFRFTAPPNPTFIKFAKDAAFAGSVDDVSIKVESQAYRIQDAPAYSRDMFVDPNGIVVLLGTVQVNGVYNAMCIRTSDQRNNRSWTPNDKSQAYEQVLSLGSEIRGGLAARGQNLIWTDTALYTMRYQGSTDTFRVDPVGTGCGLIHKNAVIEHNGLAFWWASDQNFRIYTGGIQQIIDCPLRADVMDNLAPGQESKITCGVNSAFNEIWWLYPDARDGIECSRYVVYNWSENDWYVGKLNRSQWIGDGVFPNPIGLGTDGMIYFQELGLSANGDELEWLLEGAWLDLGEGDTLMRVDRFVPDFEDQQGLIQMWLTFKPFPVGVETTYGPYDIRTDVSKIDFRHTGRQMRATFKGKGAPAFARFGSIKMNIIETGARR